LGKSRPTNKAEMIASVRIHLYRRQKATSPDQKSVSGKACPFIPPDQNHSLFAGLFSKKRPASILLEPRPTRAGMSYAHPDWQGLCFEPEP
jgi:hypothetical protein